MSRNTRRYFKVYHEHFGDAPWPCEYCGEVIEKHGKDKRDGVIHHRDNDEMNDDHTNLVMLHHDCHMRLHMVGVQKSSEHAAKVNAANRGQHRTDDARERMRDAQLSARATCNHCGKTSSKTGIARHKCVL